MKTTAKILSFLILMATVTSGAARAQDDVGADKARLEEQFAKLMSNCQMAGAFTDENAKDKPPQEERYTLSKVTKIGPDRWRIGAKVEYLGISFTLPFAVDVKWAGDTPMIQVTDLKIPLMGTYLRARSDLPRPLRGNLVERQAPRTDVRAHRARRRGAAPAHWRRTGQEEGPHREEGRYGLALISRPFRSRHRRRFLDSSELERGDRGGHQVEDSDSRARSFLPP